MTMVTEYNIQKVRDAFPILEKKVNGHPLVYLDNAATTQKPLAVIEAVSDFYKNHYGTVHRGVYELSQEATNQCEGVRRKVRDLIHAKRDAEIIFTRGTTESLNLVAFGYGLKVLKPGDEILISTMEHHANIVPWQEVCKKTGAVLKVAAISVSGEVLMADFNELLTDKTKIVSICHVSNTLGTVNPIQEIAAAAHEVGAVVVVDGAQAVSHFEVDVEALGCDFYAFSGHKMYGPTGIGVLYGKAELLDAMDPYLFGGDMIETVTFEETRFAKAPNRFEGGTPPIAQIVGLGAAIDYVNHVGLDRIQAYEHELLDDATQKLSQIKGLKIYGEAPKKSAVISFVADFAHPHDLGTILDQKGIAIRTGQHCTQPLMDFYEISATARASFAHYNTKSDVDALARAIEEAREIFL